MTDYAVAMWARISAVNARIVGMQMENMQRQHRGESMAYTEDNFQSATNELDYFAEQIQRNG